jgi:hypothetical protein
MVSTAKQIPQRPQTAERPGTSLRVMIYPTPPPFSSHTHENNGVTSKKAKMTCQNKQLTFQSLSDFSSFAPGMQ